jgi:hypothetical protein
MRNGDRWRTNLVLPSLIIDWVKAPAPTKRDSILLQILQIIFS